MGLGAERGERENVCLRVTERGARERKKEREMREDMGDFTVVAVSNISTTHDSRTHL